MRVLTAVVEIATLALFHPGQDLPLRRAVALQLLRDAHPWDVLEPEWSRNSHLIFHKRERTRSPLDSPHALRNSTRLSISAAVRCAIRRSRRRIYSPTEY